MDHKMPVPAVMWEPLLRIDEETMYNTYWPIFKNLETEFTKLSFSIHINDDQLKVYSPKIIDLILRAAAEIESISKELYKVAGGPEKRKIKFDRDALMFLDENWKLDKKSVFVTHLNCNLSKTEIIPFTRCECRTKREYRTYSWNNSYQDLKHDRANSISLGSIKYLLDILAALFILNVYYRDIKYDLGSDPDGIKFLANQGSEIFSVSLNTRANPISLDREIKCDVNFDKYIYYLRVSDDSAEECRNHLEKIIKIGNNETPSNEFRSVLDYAHRTGFHLNLKYEALLNKGCVQPYSLDRQSRAEPSMESVT